MDENQKQAQTPGQFLSEVAKSLKAKKDIDQALAEIVEKHILVGEPEEKAVANAKVAIVALAAARAKPEPEADNV